MTAAPPFEAFFMPAAGDAGRRLCVFHRPAGPARGAILHVAAFAEEMNKSRRMVALQCRAFARAGFAVLQIDLLGCGDSDGDFGDASWQAWIDDIVHAASWLRREVPVPPSASSSAPSPAASITLWGLRSGCLLAAAAASRIDAPCDFLFWQPTSSGKTVLQQFLRLKTAGAMLTGDARLTTQNLRDQLRRGESLDVAGYVVSPALADGLEQAMLAPPPKPGRLDWFEVASDSGDTGDGLSPAFDSARMQWSARGHAVRGRSTTGPMFWQTTEIEEAPALIAATLEAVETSASA